MAYQVIDPITLTPKVTNDTTYAVTIADYGLTLVNDDYVLLFVHSHATTGTLSISGSGWSELAELDVTSGGQMAVYACKVASGTVADPTITATVTTTWQVVLQQWRDVVTGAAVSDGFEIPTPTQANASSLASPTFTPADNDGTIIYFGTARGGTGQHCRFLSDKIVASANPQVDVSSSSFAMAIGTVQQATKAATSQTMYATESNRLGCITLAVKNKTGGKPSRDCRAAMTKIGWFGSYGTTHESLGSLTFNAPSTFCVWNAGTEAMSGINLSTTAATASHTTQGLPPFQGRYSEFASAVNATEWVGLWWATPSTLDMTGKIFTMEWFMAQLGDAIGEKGVVVAFGDNASADTGNAAVFQLAPKLQIAPNVLQTSHIAVETGTQLASVGSINWATINKIGIFYHRAGSTTNRVFDWRNMFLHGSHVMTGGSATRPLNAQFLHDVLNGWGYTNLCTRSGDAMLAKTSFQFGDGTAATYLDTTATLINTPAKYSVNTQPYWNVPANAITLGVKGAAGDTLNFTSSALVAGPGAEQNFTVDAATSATALPSLQGGVFGNWLWTGDTDFDAVGATYSGCDEVAWKGATVTNCTVTDTTSTDAAASVDANTTITSTTIDGTGALYALELGSSVTAITLADCTLTAGSTDKVHVLATTGTVTITISGSTSLVAGDVTSAGATVVIAAPELYQSVVVNGFTAGSRLQIYDVDYNFTVTGVTTYPAAGQTYEDLYGRVYTVISSGAGAVHAYGVTSPKLTGTLTLTKTSAGTGDATITYTACSDDGTELFNGTASAGNTVISGSTATWTDNVAASATRYIRLRRSYMTASTASEFLEQIIGTCGITEGTETVTYLDSPVTDESYETNGIDGSTVTTVTFTDAATDLVNCNVPGGSITWQSIYAAFVYYFFTATGIADDIAYAESPDTANYLFTSTKVKNTSSGPVVPLTITGGYGRDAITGLSSDIIDTSGGSIFLAPDHVVAYATGSGALTAGDITNIWSAATRTITTTIPTASDVATQVLTSAQSAPIHADVRKVTGVTVTGAGTEADPWGP